MSTTESLQTMADIAQDAGMHPDEINAVCDSVTKRSSSLINRAEVRRRLIEEAQRTRFYWQQFSPRVSEETLDKIERSVWASVQSIAEKLPSKGKTI